jgi:PAS domain S-box-containing protein
MLGRPTLLPVVRASAVVGTVWLAMAFLVEPGYMRNVSAWIMAVLLASVWVASFARISDPARFAVVEIAYFGVALSAVLVSGSSPAVPVLLALYVLLATICYGTAAGVLAGAVSLLVVAFGGWGWTTGFLPIGPAIPAPAPGQVHYWARTAFAQAIGICGIVGIVSYLAREMRGVLLQLDLVEQKFSRVFRVCPDAMVIADLESGRLIEVNQSHEELTGYGWDEAVGRTAAELGMFPDAQELSRLSAELRATGSVRRVERQIRNRSGRTLDVSYSAECFEFAGRRYAVVIMQDVTERKQTDAALKANEGRFRSFVENATVGIYRSTPDGRIVLANRALIRIMGYDSLEELASRNLEEEGYEPSYSRRAFKEQLESKGAVRGWETAWRRRDGSTIHVRESASAIRGPDGAVQFYDGIIEDISERKTAEEALRESEERFRNLTAAAFEGVFITENGTVIDANDQGLRLLGFERSEVIGHRVAEFISPESRDLVESNIREQREVMYQHRMLRKDGSSFDVEAQAKMMRVGKRALRMTAIRDISERLQNERRQRNLEEQLRQTQKMEALGTLAGGIAHDFNNILTAIFGNLQLAEMELPAGHPARETMESSLQACRRARDLVARILSFSRLEQENRAAADLGPTILEAVQLLRAGLPANIEIRTEIDAACPQVVFDSSQVHQVVMNMGTNSIHAMKDGGGVLEVALRPVAPGAELIERNPQITEDHTVCLTIRDTGCGMEPAVLERVFEPFYTTKASGKGTGLGLAMVHAIVQSHSGAIIVDSTPGAGTRFDVYFPAAGKAAAPADAGKEIERRHSIHPFGKARAVMLVDDEEAVLKVGAKLLKRLDFLPMTYERPADALEAFQAAPDAVCAVISDLTMPEMNGLEFAERLLAIRPDIPVVLASGYLPSETQNKARAIGVRSVISKPFELHELTAQLGHLLKA